MRNILILNILLLAGCQYFQPKEEIKEKVIARVGEKELVESSLTDLIPANSSAADSAVFAEKFVLDWVKKQLMISRAEDAIDFNEARIQKKVLDYQYALMVHELEQKYIDANLNEEVSDDEIAAYYDEKSENFVLRQNLAKCVYFKVPSKAPNVWRLRRSLKNYPQDSTELWEYANEHAVKAFVEDSVWVKFDEVLLETPLKDVTDKAAFLKTNSSVEVSDEDFIYFLRIFEYKVVGEVAPLEFIKESIADIIINKRKIALKKELEKKIYEEAEKTNAFEIYSN
ncbi:MAG: peptidyl-prolyl cis-trans isomerase [Ekhidna sp.]|uniref:peptidyl-prolyl cis-trans isomerase n=1 Tax=Ekhidna sp. TaxID=2608089 RepID=UPI0032EB0D00